MAVLPSKKPALSMVAVACLLSMGLLVGCAHNAQPVVYTPQPVPSITAEEKAAQEAAAVAARQAEEKRVADEAARAEAARAAEEQARQQAARQAAQQQPAPQAAKPTAPRPQTATGGNAASTPRSSTSQASAGSSSSANASAEKRSTEVAKQQARIAQLRKQIADNKAETAKVESANTSLKQAIKAAESLSATLSEEQKKYTTADPKTGKTAEPLAKDKIDELSAEVQKLSKEAAALTAKPATK
jgi:colicin import membrane protein